MQKAFGPLIRRINFIFPARGRRPYAWPWTGPPPPAGAARPTIVYNFTSGLRTACPPRCLAPRPRHGPAAEPGSENSQAICVIENQWPADWRSVRAVRAVRAAMRDLWRWQQRPWSVPGASCSTAASRNGGPPCCAATRAASLHEGWPTPPGALPPRRPVRWVACPTGAPHGEGASMGGLPGGRHLEGRVPLVKRSLPAEENRRGTSGSTAG